MSVHLPKAVRAALTSLPKHPTAFEQRVTKFGFPSSLRLEQQIDNGSQSHPKELEHRSII